MDRAQIIPLHSFATDDASSIAFKANTLREISRYDASIPHRHNYYELFFFVRGSGTHVIDFEEYPIRDASVHFVSPGQVHQLRREEGTYGHVAIFSRDFFYMNSSSRDLLFSLPFLNNSPYPALYLQEGLFEEIFALQQQIEREFASDDPIKFDIIRSYLHILLLKCKRAYEESQPEKRESSAQTVLLNSFRSLLERNFSSWHFVREYCSELAVSEKVLNEATKSLLGKTASEMIHERILLEAKRLLAHAQLTNKEIAYALNFEDPAHFSKFFKKKAGISPVDFRRNFIS